MKHQFHFVGFQFQEKYNFIVQQTCHPYDYFLWVQWLQVLPSTHVFREKKSKKKFK